MPFCLTDIQPSGVAVVTLQHAPVNALSAPVFQEFADTIQALLNNSAVRAIVITGAGKAFVAGGDIKEIAQISGKEDGITFAQKGQDIFTMMENATKPFIAAINGYALGGGLEVALGCHIRLADSKAQLGFPEIKLGILPGFGGTVRAVRFIGRARASEMILSGDFLSAAQAEQYGLVNCVVPEGTVVAEAIALAERIALRGRPAIQSAMQAIAVAANEEQENAMRFEREAFGTLCATSL